LDGSVGSAIAKDREEEDAIIDFFGFV